MGTGKVNYEITPYGIQKATSDGSPPPNLGSAGPDNVDEGGSARHFAALRLGQNSIHCLQQQFL